MSQTLNVGNFWTTVTIYMKSKYVVDVDTCPLEMKKLSQYAIVVHTNGTYTNSRNFFEKFENAHIPGKTICEIFKM